MYFYYNQTVADLSLNDSYQDFCSSFFYYLTSSYIITTDLNNIDGDKLLILLFKAPKYCLPDEIDTNSRCKIPGANLICYRKRYQ